MIPILLKVLRTDTPAEDPPAPREEWRSRASALQADILAMLGRALEAETRSVKSLLGEVTP